MILNETTKFSFTWFLGILNIIGGCSWWQIWIYLIISLQQVIVLFIIDYFYTFIEFSMLFQIPHAMFNLSVVYMMFKPEHWCKVSYRWKLPYYLKLSNNWPWRGDYSITYCIWYIFTWKLVNNRVVSKAVVFTRSSWAIRKKTASWKIAK